MSLLWIPAFAQTVANGPYYATRSWDQTLPAAELSDGAVLVSFHGVTGAASPTRSLLPLDRMFGADFEDGSLDQLLLSGLPSPAVACAKALAHWLTTGLPLLVVACPLAAMLRMDAGAQPALLAGLLPGTLDLSLLGTAGAAVVLGARRGGVVLPLLVIPLMVPVLIFGAAAPSAATMGLSPKSSLLLLLAILSAGAPVCLLAAGAALRGAAE